MPVNGKLFVFLPTLDRGDPAAEERGNLFPRVKAVGSDVRDGVWGVWLTHGVGGAL